MIGVSRQDSSLKYRRLSLGYASDWDNIRTFTTQEAASYLGVSDSTLRAWERRFGFPASSRAGARRLFRQADLASLAAALREGLSIESAMIVARDGHGGDARALIGAVASFQERAADSVMDASLSLRSVEESLEHVLLPALDSIADWRGQTSAMWAFGCSWSDAWLTGARRLAPRASHDDMTVLIGDATTTLDRLRPRVQALALCCVRAGLHVIVLNASASQHTGDLVVATKPAALVVAGTLSDTSARWGFQIAKMVPGIPCSVYGPETGEANRSGRMLPWLPTEAADRIYDGVRQSPRAP